MNIKKEIINILQPRYSTLSNKVLREMSPTEKEQTLKIVDRYFREKTTHTKNCLF